MSFAPIIKEIGRGTKGSRDLSAADAQALFGAILDQTVPPLELGAILLSLRIKGESESELDGFMAALDARTPQFGLAQPSPRCVVIPTYNGARRQPNYVPLLALLLSRLGVPVLIHGRHDFDSRVSPFELLAALGIECQADLAAAQARLDAGDIACVATETLVPGLDQLLALRPRLGVRNSGHSVGKLLDPLRGHSVRLVAVTHPEYVDRMAGYLSRNAGTALLMRGTEGEAYANPRRCPAMYGYADGQVLAQVQQDEGGAAPVAGQPESPAVADNAAAIRAMLAGELPIPQPILEQAALCLVLAGAAPDLGSAQRRLTPA